MNIDLSPNNTQNQEQQEQQQLYSSESSRFQNHPSFSSSVNKGKDPREKEKEKEEEENEGIFNKISSRRKITVGNKDVKDTNDLTEEIRSLTRDDKTSFSSNRIGNIINRIIRFTLRAYRSRLWQQLAPFSRQKAHIEASFGSGIASFFSFFITVIYVNITLIFVYVGLVVWAWLVFPPRPYSELVDRWKVAGIVGIDGLEESFMYYGGYASSKQGPWDMPLAYTCAILLSAIVSLLFAIFKVSKRDRSGNSKNVEQVVFGMWDHSLTKASAVKELRRAMYAALKEIQVTQTTRTDDPSLGWKGELLLILGRGAGIVLSIILILIGFVGILVVSLFQDYFSDIFFLLPSIIINSINAVFPVALRWLVWMERWEDPAVIERNQLVRVYLLKMFNLCIVLVGIANSGVTYTSEGDPVCTETHAGRLFWQMLLIDAFTSPLLITLAGWLTRLVSGKTEFVISSNVIDVLYRQAIILVGSMTCPLIPILGTVSNIITFFTMAQQMSAFYVFPSKPLSSSKSSNFLSTSLFIHTIIEILPVIYFLNRQTSGICGPHRNQKPINQLVLMLQGAPDDLRVVLSWLTHPLVLAALLIIIVIFFFIYVRRTRSSQRASQQIIRNLKKSVKLHRRGTLQQNSDDYESESMPMLMGSNTPTTSTTPTPTPLSHESGSHRRGRRSKNDRFNFENQDRRSQSSDNSHNGGNNDDNDDGGAADDMSDEGDDYYQSNGNNNNRSSVRRPGGDTVGVSYNPGNRNRRHWMRSSGNM